MVNTDPPPVLITPTTLISLSVTVFLLVAAYLISTVHLPSHTTTVKTRTIYIWHLFDALIHFILEGSFLYYSLTASSPILGNGDAVEASPRLYGSITHLYGTVHSSAPLARLWQEYARADVRWGSSDLGIVCVELATVFFACPAAAWIVYLLGRGDGESTARAWWWIVIVAVAEIYGGWMTFSPEWISGNPNLVTENWMYKWLYLVFFNGLWVVIPLWLLLEAYRKFVPALSLALIEKEKSTEKTGKKQL